MIEDWTSEQREAFDRDGFLIVEEGFIDGGRSAWLDAELAQDLGGVLAQPGHRS